MQKISLVLIIAIIFLSGCGFYNLNNFVLPDDMEFIQVVESLDTLEKLIEYMQDNFTYVYHYFYAPDPYSFWKLGEGDCNDFSTFATYVWHYHGGIGYQICIVFKGLLLTHYIAVYLRWNGYSFSDNAEYFWQGSETFREIVERDSVYQNKEWISYTVYDYENNIIERGKNK